MPVNLKLDDILRIFTIIYS